VSDFSFEKVVKAISFFCFNTVHCFQRCGNERWQIISTPRNRDAPKATDQAAGSCKLMVVSVLSKFVAAGHNDQRFVKPSRIKDRADPCMRNH